MFRLAFIGFGVVGQGLAQILLEQQDILKDAHSLDFTVIAISDPVKGSVYDENGLDLQKILEIVNSTGNIDDYPRGIKGWDSIKTITDTDADIIVEVTWTDIKTGEPAITHLKTAIESKKHAVTTNKGPIALSSAELAELARTNGVELRFEGTVLSGTPAINLGTTNLAGSGITKIEGIVNGTTNYILTEMEKDLDYATALKQAQDLGYAEADPTADVEGLDALGKVVILANTIMNGSITKEDVSCKGITQITPEDIKNARKEGKKWKLIAGAEKRTDGSIEAYVQPQKIPLDHPLASIAGPVNALTFTTKYLGDVTIIGPGAGKLATGYSLLTDILDIHRKISRV